MECLSKELCMILPVDCCVTNFDVRFCFIFLFENDIVLVCGTLHKEPYIYVKFATFKVV